MKVTTIDELDALPIGSVILDIDGDAWQMRDVVGHVVTGEWAIAAEALSRREMETTASVAEYLPVTVLHIPGRNLVQEAQAEARDEGYADGFHDIDWAHTPNPYRNEAP